MSDLTQWAYNEGWKAASSKLNQQDDDQDQAFSEVATPYIKEASSLDKQLDVDRYNDAEKFINDLDGPVIQEIQEKQQPIKQLLSKIDSVMSGGEQEGLTTNNSSSYADITAQYNQLSMYVENYTALIEAIKALRPLFDKYTAAMAAVTGQG